MENNPSNTGEKKKLSDWLEVLQQESWQLELIISGFAIFLVGGLKDPLRNLVIETQVLRLGIGDMELIIIPVFILFVSWYFLLFNLILHVLLRGLWISTIGLRYVSGDIDFDKLNYTKKFDTFLRKRIVSFDNYIERLERLCSIVFGFTFLIIFGLISSGLFFLFVSSINYLLSYILGEPSDSMLSNIIFTTFNIATFVTVFIYFVDFLSLGFFKKRKWMSKIYYPIYRFYGFITLANIYRPMYYNLIDNKFGRRVGKLIVPYILIVIYFIGIETSAHKYYPELKKGDLIIQDDFYLDIVNKQKYKDIDAPIIQSKYISNNYLELFIPYIGNIDDSVLASICPEFKTQKQIGFSSSTFRFGFGKKKRDKKAEMDSSMYCMEKMYNIMINDSLYEDINYRFYTRDKFKEPGIITIIDIDHLLRGENILKVDKQKTHSWKYKDSIVEKNFATIPFWVE